jgi:hypothetical protein
MKLRPDVRKCLRTSYSTNLSSNVTSSWIWKIFSYFTYFIHIPNPEFQLDVELVQFRYAWINICDVTIIKVI